MLDDTTRTLLQNVLLSEWGTDLMGLQISLLPKHCPACKVPLQKDEKLEDEKVEFWKCPQCNGVFTYAKKRVFKEEEKKKQLKIKVVQRRVE